MLRFPLSPRNYLALGVLAFLGLTQAAQSAVVISLATNSADFDDDVAGSTAGPYTDAVTAVTGTITTTQVTDTTGVAGDSLNFGGSQSGIGVNTSISLLESWSFTWDVATQLTAIDFSALNAGLNAQIQSNAWIGASITPGSANVSFSSVTGTFQFNGSQSGDGFNLAEMYGTSTIPIINPGTTLTISSVSGDGFSIGTGFTWNLLAVPEPNAIALLLGATGMFLGLRRRKH